MFHFIRLFCFGNCRVLWKCRIYLSWIIIIIHIKYMEWIISLYVSAIDLLFFSTRTSWFAFKLSKNLLALYHRESLGKTNLRSKLNERQREKLRNGNGSMCSILVQEYLNLSDYCVLVFYKKEIEIINWKN